MNENTCDKACRRHAFIVVLGMTVLVLLMMMSIVGAAPYAYVTNSGADTVSVIDTATDKVTATVDVGKDPYGVAVSPDGKKIYVTSKVGVSVIDTSTNTVTATVKECYGLIAVALGGSKVYAETGTNGPYGGFAIIDAATNKVSSTIDNEDIYPVGIAVNKNGSKVYVATEGWMDSNYGVSVIDTATNNYTGNIALPYEKDPIYRPSNVAVNSTGTKVYTTWTDGTVSITDIDKNTVTANVTVGQNPKGIAVNPDGTKAYVTNHDSNTVSVIDTATNKVIATVPTGRDPVGVAVTPDGTKVYVANSGNNSVPGNTVSVIDTVTNTVTATVCVGSYPVGVTVGNLSKISNC